MNFKSIIKTVYTGASLVTVASIILLTLSFTNSFDALNGYFNSGILPILFWIAFITGIVISLVSAFAIRKNEIIKTEDPVSDHKLIYILFAAALAICALLFNILTISNYFTLMIVGVCAFALFIMLCAAKDGYKYSHLKLLFLLLSVLFPLLMTFDNNAVMDRHSNSVENTLTSIFSIAFLIYILYEGNRIFKGEHSRWHFASMLLVSHTGLTFSVSYVAAYIIGSVYETQRLYQVVIMLIISAFVELELLRFVSRSESRTKEEWEALETPQEETIEK